MRYDPRTPNYLQGPGCLLAGMPRRSFDALIRRKPGVSDFIYRIICGYALGRVVRRKTVEYGATGQVRLLGYVIGLDGYCIEAVHRSQGTVFGKCISGIPFAGKT